MLGKSSTSSTPTDVNAAAKRSPYPGFTDSSHSCNVAGSSSSWTMDAEEGRLPRSSAGEPTLLIASDEAAKEPFPPVATSGGGGSGCSQRQTASMRAAKRSQKKSCYWI